MSKSRGHHRHEEHEEHEEHVNHEAWVIPYADMLTLLMALFLVLFAVGQTDLAKFKKLAESFRNEFGDASSGEVVDVGGTGESAAADGGGGVLSADAPAPADPERDGTGADPNAASGDTGGGPVTTLDPADQALGEKRAAQAAAVDEATSLEGVREAVERAAAASGLSGSLNLTLDARGLVVTIVTDQVLFDPGSADLQPAGVTLLDVVGHALQTVPNDIVVEGHTDDRPISNGRFADNWDLSNARATSVVRYFMEHDGIAPERLTASGRAATRPVADNSTPVGASKNRRVEVIVNAEVSLEPVLGDDGAVHTDDDGQVVVPQERGGAEPVLTPDVVPHVEPDLTPVELAGATG